VKRVFPGFINPAETQTAFSDPPVGGLSYEGGGRNRGFLAGILRRLLGLDSNTLAVSEANRRVSWRQAVETNRRWRLAPRAGLEPATLRLTAVAAQPRGARSPQEAPSGGLGVVLLPSVGGTVGGTAPHTSLAPRGGGGPRENRHRNPVAEERLAQHLGRSQIRARRHEV
jgi:hypothetical protein